MFNSTELEWKKAVDLAISCRSLRPNVDIYPERVVEVAHNRVAHDLHRREACRDALKSWPGRVRTGIGLGFLRLFLNGFVSLEARFLASHHFVGTVVA